MGWRGRATEREVKFNFYASRATLTMDWCGRATEREVKLQHLGFSQGSRGILCRDWRGRACERKVKLLLFGFPHNLVRLYEAIERST